MKVIGRGKRPIKRRIRDLKIDEVVWVVPWAIRYHEDGTPVDINLDATFEKEKSGTAKAMVRRISKDYLVVDVTKAYEIQ